MGLISEIISGVITPITNVVGQIFAAKSNETVETAKTDGAVAQSWIVAVGHNLGNTLLVLAELAFILPLAVYFGKCVLFDNIVSYYLYGHYGYTPPLGADIKNWSGWIVGYLFLKVSTKGYR